MTETPAKKLKLETGANISFTEIIDCNEDLEFLDEKLANDCQESNSENYINSRDMDNNNSDIIENGTANFEEQKSEQQYISMLVKRIETSLYRSEAENYDKLLRQSNTSKLVSNNTFKDYQKILCKKMFKALIKTKKFNKEEAKKLTIKINEKLVSTYSDINEYKTNAYWFLA